jgi:hypothetical protein
MATGDEILAWKKAAEEQPPEPLTECPNDGWTLEETDRGLHCPFCGKVY